MDQDEVEVHKDAKRERGQYPTILIELARSIIYIYIYIYSLWDILCWVFFFETHETTSCV